MGAGAWTSLPCLSVDTETTSVKPFSARIVEVAAVEVYPDGVASNPWSTIVDPGIEIPDEAAAIHKITTERARAEGVSPQAALHVLADRIWDHIETHRGLAALVMFNTPYDLPLILAECARHDVDMPPFAGILDPLVLDRAADWYRRDEHVHFQPVAHTHAGGWEQARRHRASKRKLVLLAERLGVELGDAAHGALADATAAGQVLWKIVQLIPKIADNSLASLWVRQVHGDEKGRSGFQDWIRRERDPLEEIVGGWPIPVRVEKDAAAKAPRRPRPRPAPARDPVPMDETQNRRVHALLAKARPGQDRHAVLTELLGRPITSAKELSTDDAQRVVDALDKEAKASA